MSKQISCIEDAINIIREIKLRIEKADSTDTFVHYLQPDNFIYGIWFRGENDFGEGGLTPSVFRTNTEGNYYNETTIFDYLPTINDDLRKFVNSFDRLCHMQHYDIPTRLLDWTDSILIALYFAVKYNLKVDSKLFVLNARALNEYSSLKKGHTNIHVHNSFGTKFRMLMVNSDNVDSWVNVANGKLSDYNWSDVNINENIFDFFDFTRNDVINNAEKKIQLFCTPIAVRPNHINKRLLFQNGLFTLHGGKMPYVDERTPIPKPISLFDLNKKSPFNFLEEYKIPADAKHDILNDLLNLRIHEGALFPELDKQANFVKLISQ